MSLVFPREPRDGWSAGDVAFCVNPTKRSRPPIERGRTYRVEAAYKPQNIGHHGLKLVGVDTPDLWGFWSNRFIRLAPRRSWLAQIVAATEYTIAHYWNRPASAGETQGGSIGEADDIATAKPGRPEQPDNKALSRQVAKDCEG